MCVCVCGGGGGGGNKSSIQKLKVRERESVQADGEQIQREWKTDRQVDWLQSPVTKYFFLIILFDNPLR